MSKHWVSSKSNSWLSCANGQQMENSFCTVETFSSIQLLVPEIFLIYFYIIFPKCVGLCVRWCQMQEGGFGWSSPLLLLQLQLKCITMETGSHRLYVLVSVVMSVMQTENWRMSRGEKNRKSIFYTPLVLIHHRSHNNLCYSEGINSPLCFSTFE